jgi:NitT/TauT family transport system substrate-binding protein
MRRWSLLVLIAGNLFATAASAEDGPAMTKVRVAFDGFSMTSAPMYYADKKGIFRSYGLDIAPFFVAGGSTLTQSVVGGSIDIAQNGYTPAAAAAVQGADIVFIGGISNKLPFQLVVKNGIDTAAQLKGANIAISKYGSSTDTATDFALAELGLTRDDVHVLQLGGEATRYAAALSGQISGTLEQYPNTAELATHGFHVLVDVTDIAGEYPNTSYVTTRAYLKDHKEIVKRFFQAMATAIHDYKTDPDEAVRLTQEFLDIKDGGIARQAYESYSRKVYPDIPRPSLAGLALVLKELSKTLPNAAEIKPEQLVDTTALDELQREKFFAQLLAQR